MPLTNAECQAIKDCYQRSYPSAKTLLTQLFRKNNFSKRVQEEKALNILVPGAGIFPSHLPFFEELRYKFPQLKKVFLTLVDPLFKLKDMVEEIMPEQKAEKHSINQRVKQIEFSEKLLVGFLLISVLIYSLRFAKPGYFLKQTASLILVASQVFFHRPDQNGLMIKLLIVGAQLALFYEGNNNAPSPVLEPRRQNLI